MLHRLLQEPGGHRGHSSPESLCEASRGGRSMRRAGGHRHAPNLGRKLSGEQRMSRISRVGCVHSGLGENKAQGSPTLLPLPPRFLLAQDRDRWLPGEGSVRAGAGLQLPAFGEAGRLCVPQFPLAEMFWVQQGGPQVLACWGWPWRARLLCAGAAVLWGCSRGVGLEDGACRGRRGLPSHVKLCSLVLEQAGRTDGCHALATALNSWASTLHLQCLQLRSLLESSGVLPGCCGQGVVGPGKDSVSGEDWERGSPREQLPCPRTLTRPVLPPC